MFRSDFSNFLSALQATPEKHLDLAQVRRDHAAQFDVVRRYLESRIDDQAATSIPIRD